MPEGHLQIKAEMLLPEGGLRPETEPSRHEDLRMEQLLLGEEVERLERLQLCYEKQMQALVAEPTNLVPIDIRSKAIRRHRCLGEWYSRPWTHIRLKKCSPACRLEPAAKREYLALRLRQKLTTAKLSVARQDLSDHRMARSP